MAIHDRGLIKWQPAAFLTEQTALLREALIDCEREAKPVLDEYQLAEFDTRIAYAMEYLLDVRLSVWANGFTEEVVGFVHYINPITKDLRVKKRDGSVERLEFEALVGVEVDE
ncbi:YolD-like family protein [Peribacillus huizhouensis]|uniref:YolD-like family protein n=1 Tax=Peribacillus huizhouensis TaxID=1501239 RepID=A0ABR6CS63_9BACI|nr:YolD-like family protein [Peribacillus huizhouensis]MBA9027493.1 hypothetical protein [Peribacillus huizhouensis]